MESPESTADQLIELTVNQYVRLEAARILAHQFRDQTDARPLAEATLVLAEAIVNGTKPTHS